MSRAAWIAALVALALEAAAIIAIAAACTSNGWTP